MLLTKRAKNTDLVTFGLVLAVKIRIVMYLFVTQFNLVDGHETFGRTYCHLLLVTWNTDAEY